MGELRSSAAHKARRTASGQDGDLPRLLFVTSPRKEKHCEVQKGAGYIFAGRPCDDVLYIQSGNAKLTIVNPQGKEAVPAIVGPGDFLGEDCIIRKPGTYGYGDGNRAAERDEH
jgi:CRP-like cAMP-binding protein